MAKPNLQIACDYNDLPSALADLKNVGDAVDIIEAGTILLLQGGQEVVKSFRALYPDKIIVADTKCADAGGTVAKNCADAGADWMTCICSATIPTMKQQLKKSVRSKLSCTGIGPLNKHNNGWMLVFLRQYITRVGMLYWQEKLGGKKTWIKSKN